MPRLYSMATRAAVSESTRARILEAALDELVAVGNDRITLRGVADRADVALRTLYNHFPNRNDLLIAAYLRHVAQTRAAVEPVAVPDSPPEDQLRHVVGGYYAGYARMGPRLGALLSLQGIPELQEQIREIRAWRRRVLGAIVRRARHAGTLAVPERTAVALAFTMTSHSTWSSLMEELGGDERAASRAATQALTAALLSS